MVSLSLPVVSHWYDPRYVQSKRTTSDLYERFRHIKSRSPWSVSKLQNLRQKKRCSTFWSLFGVLEVKGILYRVCRKQGILKQQQKNTLYSCKHKTDHHEAHGCLRVIKLERIDRRSIALPSGPCLESRNERCPVQSLSLYKIRNIKNSSKKHAACTKRTEVFPKAPNIILRFTAQFVTTQCVIIIKPLILL